MITRFARSLFYTAMGVVVLFVTFVIMAFNVERLSFFLFLFHVPLYLAAGFVLDFWGINLQSDVSSVRLQALAFPLLTGLLWTLFMQAWFSAYEPGNGVYLTDVALYIFSPVIIQLLILFGFIRLLSRARSDQQTGLVQSLPSWLLTSSLMSFAIGVVLFLLMNRALT